MALLSIAVLIILLFRSGNDGAKIFGAIAFCTSMFILYANSCLYHSVTNQNAKTKVFRRLDHCSIYLLIVGTYSVVLLTLPGMEREWFPGSLSVGISLLILQWSLAIVGITCKCICVKKLHWVHVCMFLLLGWSSMLIIVDIWKAGPLFFWLIVSGGLCYSLGVIFYAIKKVKYFHFVWHIFVMAGTILHIIAIIMVLYPV